MPKSSQTPSKAKSSSKTEVKSKKMKPKSKKIVKSSSEPAPTPAPSPSISSTVPIPSSLNLVVLTIPISIEPSLPKPTIRAYVPTSKNTSKSTKIKATQRKSVKSDKTEDEDDNGGEKEEVIVGNHEGHHTQNITNEEKRERMSHEEKESEIEDRIDEQVDDSAEEEMNSKEEGESDSEGEDQEKASSSEGEDEESEEENENTSGESEGSMTIGNTVISPSEEASREKRTEKPGPLLTPFIGDEKVSSDKYNLPLSEVGKKPRKTHVKAKKSAESRAAKKPRKQVLVVESVVELDGENESNSTLPKKSLTQKRKVVKATKIATPFARANRGKKRKNMPVVVDKLTKFKNRKLLNGKILAN
ncbi:protein gar2-like [Nicotiana sylvestris]|uniref:protein gar2-like n=1 Tax=Nicotiana sylvestris TaxID=4096 RepID=UPI00388C8952